MFGGGVFCYQQQQQHQQQQPQPQQQQQQHQQQQQQPAGRLQLHTNSSEPKDDGRAGCAPVARIHGVRTHPKLGSSTSTTSPMRNGSWKGEFGRRRASLAFRWFWIWAASRADGLRHSGRVELEEERPHRIADAEGVRSRIDRFGWG